jgi:hypothetical protein
MNNSPYLGRPLLPLAVALPLMLEKIEADLATAGPSEAGRLRRRADLIHELANARGGDHLSRRDLKRAGRLRLRSSGVGLGPPPVVGPSPGPDRAWRGAGAVERGGLETLQRQYRRVTRYAE